MKRLFPYAGRVAAVGALTTGVAHAQVNDPYFPQQWALDNTGQSYCLGLDEADPSVCDGTDQGVSNVDLNAPEAWNVFQPRTDGRTVVIGLIDTGIDYNHPELDEAVWTNPGECTGVNGCEPDGVDNDCNGYVDDLHGINANDTRVAEAGLDPVPGCDGQMLNPAAGDPMDFWFGHGTAMSSAIFAKTDNGEGMAGLLGHPDVRPHVKVLTCAAGEYQSFTYLATDVVKHAVDTPAAALECLDYFIDMIDRYDLEMPVINVSAGMSQFIKANQYLGLQVHYEFLLDTPEISNAVTQLGQRGVLISAAAGNNYDNMDASYGVAFYPAAFEHDNILSVAGTDANGQRFRTRVKDEEGNWVSLDTGSNWGADGVDFAAPGGRILMAAPGGGYGVQDGTSPAAAYVSAIVGMLRAHEPTKDLSPQQIKRLLAASGAPLPDLEDRTVFGVQVRAASDASGPGALDCDGAAYQKRVAPSADRIVAVPGQNVTLSAWRFLCEQTPAQLDVYVPETGETLTLLDDGAGADSTAGDGLFTGVWTVPAGEGATYTLQFGEDTFAGNDEVSVFTDIIVDDASAATSKTWWWWTTTLRPGYYGPEYRIAYSGSGSLVFTFEPYLPLAGDYEVYMRWPAHANFASNTPVRIHHSGGSTTVRVNQEQNGAQWVSLGVYDFAAGQAAIAVSNDANGTVVADAVKLVKR